MTIYHLPKFMKTPEQLYAHQASLPSLRSYFIVWERPHGSYTWTQLGDMFTERDKANEFAKNRVDHKERPICDCVVSESKMARMPAPEGSEPVAVLATEQYGVSDHQVGAIEAMAKRWERRLREGSGPSYDPMQAGMTMQLRECLDELRAEMEIEPATELADERVARKALVEALLICIRYADSSADTEQAHAALALSAKLL